jgi:inosine-uridine nucleoside N-ribohydrolase
MAIFVALRSPELEVLGLTTTFGNVHTALATRNALHLVRCRLPPAACLPLFPHPHPVGLCSAAHVLHLMCVLQLEAVGRTDIPVAEGSHVTIKVAVTISSFLFPR